jgi:hypothetical protein
MARRGDNPTGELFVLLALTVEESRGSRGQYQYQQVVIHDLIEEFGLETVAIVQIPPCTHFQLKKWKHPIPKNPNRSNRLTCPTRRNRTPQPVCALGVGQ